MTHCTRGRFAVLVSWSGELAVYSCALLRMQMQVAKLLRGLFDRYSLLRNNNMAANLQRFSYGRRRFAACDCWTQTSLAENAARQWLLVVVSFVVLHCAVLKEAWMKEKHCCANEARFLRLLPQQQGVTRLDGARGKKQVWRPYLCLNLRSFRHCWDFTWLPQSDSAPGELFPPSTPRYAPA